MDFRSTRHGLTKSIRRFPEQPGISAIGAFRGAINPTFSTWISGHWRFLEGRLFRAVPLSFQRPANPFGQISWPQPRAAGSSFVLAPNIHLTLSLPPINQEFFENKTVKFQTWIAHEAAIVAATHNLRKISRQSNTFNFQTTSEVAASARAFWPRLFQFNPRTAETGGQLHFSPRTATGEQLGASTSPARAPMPGHLEALPASLRVSRLLISKSSTRTERPVLVTIFRDLRHWTQAITSNLVKLVSAREQGELVFLDRGRTTVEASATFDATNSALPEWLKIRPIGEPGWSRQLFLKQNNNFVLSQRPALSKSSFVSVVQNLVVPKSSDPETISRQIQHFGPSPNLSYAKTEAPQLQQQLVNALRDLRPAQTEIKAPTIELPSIAQLTAHVRQELERELRIERERRGL